MNTNKLRSKAFQIYNKQDQKTREKINKLNKSDLEYKLKNKLKLELDELEKQFKLRRDQNRLNIAYGASLDAIRSIQFNSDQLDIEEERETKKIYDKCSLSQIKKEMYIEDIEFRINYSKNIIKDLSIGIIKVRNTVSEDILRIALYKEEIIKKEHEDNLKLMREINCDEIF